jgi:hypothetical protein
MLLSDFVNQRVTPDPKLCMLILDCADFNSKFCVFFVDCVKQSLTRLTSNPKSSYCFEIVSASDMWFQIIYVIWRRVSTRQWGVIPNYIRFDCKLSMFFVDCVNQWPVIPDNIFVCRMSTGQRPVIPNYVICCYAIWRLCYQVRTCNLGADVSTRQRPEIPNVFAAIRLCRPLPSRPSSERPGLSGAESGRSVSGAEQRRWQVSPLARFWQTERRWQDTDTQTVSIAHEIVWGINSFTLRYMRSTFPYTS